MEGKNSGISIYMWLFLSTPYLLSLSVERLQLQQFVLLLRQLHFCQREVHIRHVLQANLDVLPVG